MVQEKRRVVLTNPRGFCAGVERAIDVVEIALGKYGPPVYVRKEIVHNPHVVDDLRKKGAIFVESEEEVPEGSVVVFSAHGVAPSVRVQSDARRLTSIDATCPLVTKVHLGGAEVRQRRLLDPAHRPRGPRRDRGHHGRSA